jgi:hypothetical protein
MIFKIFLPKNLAKKLACFAQTTSSFCKNCDHNIGFWEKRQFFRRKLGKIAENCDHNIDPWFEKIFLKNILVCKMSADLATKQINAVRPYVFASS